MKFEVDQKVMIVSKSVGRELTAASPDIIHQVKIGDYKYPVGWIKEYRDYTDYYVLSYSMNGWVNDYYKERDLRLVSYELLEDELFEI